MKIFKILSFVLFLGQLSVPMFGQERPPIIDMHMHIGAHWTYQPAHPLPAAPL